MDSLLSFITLFAGVVVALKFAQKKDVVEHFGMLPSMKVKALPVITVPGYYQSAVSPRFANVQYGALIRNDLPSVSHMASDPHDPLSLYNSPIVMKQVGFGDSKVEKYTGGCGNGMAGVNGGGCGSNSAQHQSSGGAQYTEVKDMLPLSSMDGTMLNALGQENVQPVIYDRYIYANQRSRLHAQGDPLRGDLPIIPIKSDWFRPSVTPNIDLRSGALMALGGLNNDTAKELAALQSASSGGSQDVGSGINYTVLHSPYTTAAQSDVHVTSFP